MSEKSEAKPSFENDPLFMEVMREALSIQNRFAAEPVYAKTGKGYLKSVGVSELQEIKEQQRTRPEKKDR